MHRIVLVLAAALAACGPKQASTGPGDDELPVPDGPADAAPAATGDELPPALVAKVEHALAYLDQVAAAAEGAGSDCAKMGADLQALADGPDGKILLEMDLDKDFQAHSSDVASRYGDQLGKLSNRIGIAIYDCNTDPVNKAITQMGLQ